MVAYIDRMTVQKLQILIAASILAVAMGQSAPAEPLPPPPTLAQETAPDDDGFPSIEDFDFPEASRDTVQRFIDMVTPFLEQFGRMVDDLPRYGAPEILPNGDILIPRLDKRPPPSEEPTFDETDGTTKT